MSNRRPFRVIIVGGGVAGLTLANILEQGNLDFVLLERHQDFTPQTGASVGVLPNGARILDQIGVWEAVLAKMDIITTARTSNSNGQPIGPPSNFNELSRSRTGYEIPWGDRQSLLEALHANVRDKAKLVAKKNVVDIEHTADGVTVRCADSSSYHGDVLIGADGVSSKTREKMSQLAEGDHPDVVKLESTVMTADCTTFFGIAEGLDQRKVGAQAGDLDYTYGPDRTGALIWSTNGKAYYFVGQKLDKTYRTGTLPRYTAEDTEESILKNGDLEFRPGLTLAELWTKTVVQRLVPAEEGAFKLWTWGRIACLGDSIHQLSPNLGASDCVAIESAAALANQLKGLFASADTSRPTEAQVRAALVAYQKGREVRVEETVKASKEFVRMQTTRSPWPRLFFNNLLFNFGESLQENIRDWTIGAAKIDFLPLPMKSLVGTMPFNPSQGIGQKESKLKRALLALPLLAIVPIALGSLDAMAALPWAVEQLESGKFDLGSGSIPIRRTFYHIHWLDEGLATLNMFFLPCLYNTDPVSRRQVIAFLSDGFVMLNIWMFESTRRANAHTIMALPIFFTLLAQALGMGIVSPLYCFLHYVWSPIENYNARDLRLTRLNYTIGVVPAVAIGYLLPAYAMFFSPNLPDRQTWLFVWQLYPISISIVLFALSRVFPNTTQNDAAYKPNRDLFVLRIYIGAGIILSVAAWVWSWMIGSYSLATLYIPTALPRSMPDLTGFVGKFLQFDELFSFSPLVIWLAYLFWDLKDAGMMDTNWLTLVSCAIIGIFALGPGATVGLGWLWREQMLATKWHKDALTDKALKKLHDQEE